MGYKWNTYKKPPDIYNYNNIFDWNVPCDNDTIVTLLASNIIAETCNVSQLPNGARWDSDDFKLVVEGGIVDTNGIYKNYAQIATMFSDWSKINTPNSSYWTFPGKIDHVNLEYYGTSGESIGPKTTLISGYRYMRIVIDGSLYLPSSYPITPHINLRVNSGTNYTYNPTVTTVGSEKKYTWHNIIYYNAGENLENVYVLAELHTQ